MDQIEDTIDKIILEMRALKQIDIEQIPSIDLYVDQVTTFIEQELGAYKRKDDDKLLTKTMINNYAKDKLFAPPIKKKYGKAHIIALILIVHLKSQLSIADIKLLLNRITDDQNDLNLETIYNHFVTIQQEECQRIQTQFDEMKQNIVQDPDLFLSTLRLIIRADLEKRLAEKIIDNFYQYGGPYENES